MMKIVKRRLQRQIKILLTALVLALCSLINRALAAEDLMVCSWEHLNGDFVKLTSGSFRDVIEPYIEWKKRRISVMSTSVLIAIIGISPTVLIR